MDRRPNLARIAVIIPAYNRAAVLARTIDSVLAQDFDDFELIVVDDGSTDATLEVARRYQDRRLRVVELGRNGGSNAARNAGIRAASAPLIAFLDSDDSFLPNKLSTVIREFDRNPDLDVLVDSYVKLTSPLAKRRRIERRNPRVDSTAEFARRLFSRELWKPTSSITVRREAALRAGLFDEDVARRQDMDFLIRLAAVANCASIDEILWVKHWSPEGLSAHRTFVSSTVALVRKHPQYLANPDYRRGLGKDLARHLLVQLKHGRHRHAAADAGLMVKQFGLARTAGLLVSGTIEMARRGRLRRRRETAAPDAREAPEAQSRG